MFERSGEHLTARFSPDEVDVLRRVAAEVVSLLTDGFDSDDPVVGRLFPDAYPERPEAAAEYRRFTEDDLKSTKIDQAGAILAALPSSGGGEIALDTEAAEAWLRGLNDVRLALGVRLDIADETSLESELDEAVLRDPTSSRVFQLSVYAYLGYLQESLLEALVE
jgi:hypothetical protein